MATTGKIFNDSSNIYQDQARLLFNFYEQAAERIVQQEEQIEGEIRDLEQRRAEVETQKSEIWVWWAYLLCIFFIPYFYFRKREKECDEQIDALNDEIAKKQEEHKQIFRDYKVTKMGVAYVPVAQQIAYEDKCFVVDYTGNVPNSRVSLQMSRQNDLLVETMTQMEQLTKEAPVVESSNEVEHIDTDEYSLSIQGINQSDYVGKLDRSLRTISFCMNDTETKSVDLPLVADKSAYLQFLNEFSTDNPGQHPVVKAFDDKRYDNEIGDFCKLNKLKDSLSDDTEQFEDVLKHLMHTMALSVQAVSAMKLASTDKMVDQSNSLLFKILKAPYNHYSPLLEADEIRRIKNERFDYSDSIQGYEPFQLRESSRVRYNLFADEWTAEDNSTASVPFGVHQIYEEIVAPMVQRLMMENRLERIRVYGQIHDQKLSYLNKWHQDVDAFYRSNHQESADIINNMQQTLSEYVEAYNTLAQLQKTLDSMAEEGATLDSTVVEKQTDSSETIAAFEMQAQEFKAVQDEFNDYMDRLQEDIALKAEQFGHVEFYDARLQDGYSNQVAVAASEVQGMDERRKPLAVTNPLLAKESVLLPQPSVEDVTYEHLSLNLPSIAVNALDAVSRIAAEADQPEPAPVAAPVAEQPEEPSVEPSVEDEAEMEASVEAENEESVAEEEPAAEATVEEEPAAEEVEPAAEADAADAEEEPAEEEEEPAEDDGMIEVQTSEEVSDADAPELDEDEIPDIPEDEIPDIPVDEEEK